jgi:hypothetical protein
MKRILSLVAVLGCFSAAGTSLFAQGIITGKVAGSVVDPTGAVIPGATIVASNASTNTKLTTTSGSDGSFSFNEVSVGNYSLTITVSGFAPLNVNNLQVSGNRTLDLGPEKLSTGSASETVEVSTAQNLLETSAAQVTTTFDAEAITNLPTSGGFDELALLIPGVVNTHSNNFSNTNGVGFSANGQRGRSNNFELDGQSNNDNSVAGPQAFFGNDEALAEIQIITNNFGAEYGRNMGSVVNYITKSGTNTFHGSGIYRYSGDFASSHATGVSKGPQFGFCTAGEQGDGCTNTVVPRYVSNKFGGTLGGPILKDKLFAFGSTYFTRFYEFGALVASTSNLFPTPAGLTALASAFPNNAGVTVLQNLNPYNVTAGNPRQLPTPVSSCARAGDTYNSANGGTCTKTVSNGVTTAQIPFAAFGRQVPQVTTDQEDLGRIDYNLTPKDRIYVRYFYQKNPTSPDGATANGGFVNVRGITHSIGADITHTFSPRWVNQLRYSFQQSTLGFDGGGFANCSITAFASCPSSVGLGAGVTGLGLPNNLPQGRVVKVGQTQDNATFTFGRQTITFGGEFDYENSPNVFLPNAAGTFTYGSINNLLAGGCGTVAAPSCTLSLTAGNPTVPFKEKDVAAYFQDDWKVTPSLTLNLGLRWEFFGQAINLLHNETVAQQTGPNPFWSTALPLSQTTFPQVNQVYHYFEPRVGFAFNPGFNKKLVVRGGYAINVDPGFYNINLNSATSAPVVNAGTITCTVAQNCLAGGTTFASVSANDTKFIPTGGNPGQRNQTLVPKNFHQPYAQTYTLGVEYQLRNAAVLEVRYTGNHTVGNFQTLDGNPVLAPVAADFPNYVSPSSICTAATSTLANKGDVGHQFCGSTNVRTRANTAFSIYNSLQTQLTTHSYHGVTATAAYTFSRTIDNSSEIFGTLGGGNTSAFAANPLDPNVGERAVSGISFPNVASVALTYAFPKVGGDRSLVGKLVNGWQANTIWLFNSGQPFTDFDYIQSQSPYANYAQGASKAFPNGTAGDIRSYQSYANIAESSAYYGYDFARPIVSNPKAPVGTIGIYTTTPLASDPTGNTNSAPFLVDYSTGAPITPDKVHFITNNRYADIIAGNPYAGSSRNILRGNTFNNVDASVFKNTKITERITFRFEADAYNIMNRSYYSTPDNYIGDAPGGSFNNFLFNTAGGSNIGPGTGVRNMEFGGKILF